jgi:hypothetical protein
MDELSEHFSSAPRNHLHVIVEVPKMREFSRYLLILANCLTDVPALAPIFCRWPILCFPFILFFFPVRIYSHSP